jgi:RNA polymerase sigma factor (sigma-70 family)
MTPAPGKAKAKSHHRGLSDASLVAACLEGKDAAWAALIDKYKNLIFSIPVHSGLSQEDAADIFQTVCMDLLKELPRLREVQALAGWLIQVTRNKCFHRKKVTLQNKTQEIGDLDPPAAVSGEPDNILAQAQQEQLLREALLELTPQCQKLLTMLFFETPPRPYVEVAKELDRSRGAIGFMRRDCLQKLRKRLESSGL